MIKKLAAIYNVFDSIELLPGSMACLKDHVDLFIVVWQNTSNYGEGYYEFSKLLAPDSFAGIDLNKIHLLRYDPRVEMGGAMNERAKRVMGLDAARMMSCTHFLHIDCDEYYEDFGAAKDEYLAAGSAGSVVRLWTYFKKPTLRVDRPEDYYVPFIHRIDDLTNTGTSSYPFWVDPTRTVNTSDVKLLENTWMHHYSWVRKDIGLKVRNSSAKKNLQRGTMLQDWNSPEVGPGFYVRDWQRNLIEVEDIFTLSPIFEF